MNAQSPEGEGYERAVNLLHKCVTPQGFLASCSIHDNYTRIWARDGAIIALAALQTGDRELIRAARNTFCTLAGYQGPHGEIPSNVDPASRRCSYGNTVGRVDSNLWFIIGCGEYWLATGDDAFLDQMLPVIEKVTFLLGAWEFNNRGLIYVPLTGDWADEFLHNGYVLYDELLYLQALRTVGFLRKEIHGTDDHQFNEKIGRLHHLIREHYWFNEDEAVPDDAYHEMLYEKMRAAALPRSNAQYWMPFFTPGGYGYRFDALANVLVSLLDVADDRQRERVDQFIAGEIVNDILPVLPAFHPVIEPVDEDWKELNMMFSYTFKNNPYEFHNGGLWPMVTGFYVADLARRKRNQEAGKYLQAIHRANAMEMHGEAWGFPEYVHGRKLTPGGTRHQGWSAAAAIIGEHALQGRPLFAVNEGAA